MNIVTPASISAETWQFISRQPYFEGVSENTLKKLLTHMEVLEYAPGEVLFWENEPVRGLYIVARGSIKLFRTSVHGREMIIRLLARGDSFAEVAVFDAKDNPVSAMALEPTRVYLLPADIYRDYLESDLRLMQNALQVLSSRTRKLVNMAAEMSFYRVTYRLANLLLELPPEKLSGKQRLSHSDLAARLGTVREVLARTLRYLQEQGGIQVTHGNIVILDRNILRRVVDDL